MKRVKEKLTDEQRKERKRAADRKYYLSHLEQKREYTRANRKRKAKYDKKYREANKAKRAEYDRQYHENVRKPNKQKPVRKFEHEP